MKRTIVLAFAAFSITACNNNEAGTTTTADSIQSTTNETTTTTYTPADGDVKYSGNKVMVMKNGAWVEADEDVKLDNGVVVYRNGRVERDGTEIELREGEVVNRTGEFFDNTGMAVANAWEVTKEGAKDSGRAVKKTAKKVGEKVEDALDGDSSRR